MDLMKPENTILKKRPKLIRRKLLFFYLTTILK